MRKTILPLVATLTLLFSTSCSENASEGEEIVIIPNTLIFNTPDINESDSSRYSALYVIHDFHHQISNDQLRAIFPALEIGDLEWNMGVVYYQMGVFSEISTQMHLAGDMEGLVLDVRISIGNQPTIPDTYLFSTGEAFKYSDMYDILVRALMRSWESGERFSFEASFAIDDAYYLIRFNDYEESGKSRMTEIVRMFIMNPIDFSVLEDPNIPEI